MVAPNIPSLYYGDVRFRVAVTNLFLLQMAHLVAHLFGKGNDTFTGKPGLVQTFEYRFRILAG